MTGVRTALHAVRRWAPRAAAPARAYATTAVLRARVSPPLAAVVAVDVHNEPLAPQPPPPSRTRPFRRERRELQKKQRKMVKKRKENDTIAARLGVTEKRVAPLVRTDHQFKTFKPITPSIRWVRSPLQTDLHRGRPVRDLTVAKRSTGGRNHHGRITVRGRGGGHRRRVRLVDFYRWEPGEQTVVRLEYDPSRSAHIALIQHRETERLSYIIAPNGLSVGDVVQSYRTMESNDADSSSLDLGIFRTHAIRPGNVLPLRLIPIGTSIHAISLLPLGPAKLVRSAGTSGQLVAFSSYKKQAPSSTELSDASGTSPGGAGTHAQVRLSSGEVRYVPVHCCAAIGEVSNKDHQHRRLGKAGRSRWLGRRPKVRGVAMNSVDHPHGGGRGKSKSNKAPRSIYGYPLKFQRTRKPGTRGANRMVLRERPRRNGKRAGKA
ncbi:mitochondrial 54S ribosomal protein rml2 [Malassezia sp. CBS 17886]|nr:mitochondrial 54S ribosomal protein rml2 [Malassezia sp. CBS 17886]